LNTVQGGDIHDVVF